MVSDGNKHNNRGSVPPPPRTLDVQKFAESRASELDAIHSVIANRWNNDFRSQRNKRRRTTSYDNRSSKSRFRKKQKVGVLEVKEVRRVPPRHIRRRKELRENPQNGFCSSGDGTKRLRTHVWHAKRFTMMKRWGFHLPLGLQGRGRGSRALLKWLRNGVVVHDASYLGAVQLEGTEDSLLSILRTVMVPFSSPQPEGILSGNIYGSSMLHHAGVSHFQAIAPVTYMWRPLYRQSRDTDGESNDSDRCDDLEKANKRSSIRQLWVWIHVAAFREGFNALTAACQRQIEIDDPTVSIKCISLEGQLASLEVMGSKASQLLQKILDPISCVSENFSALRKCSLTEADSTIPPKSASILGIEDQMPSSTIISLRVNDPRFVTNKGVGVVSGAPDTDITDGLKGYGVSEHGKVAGTGVGNVAIGSSPEDCSPSDDIDLWNASKGLCSPLEDSVICLEKHQQRLAFFCLHGKSSEEINDSTKKQASRFCPILLLRNNNLKDTIKRWSIILPLSWAKAFWVPLVTHGGRAIGLREKRWVACEAEIPYFPSDFPECTAYSALMAIEASISDKNASLYPPSQKPLCLPIPPPWECVKFAFRNNSIGSEGPPVECKKLCDDVMIANNFSIESKFGDCDGEVLGTRILSNGLVARTSSFLTHFLSDIKSDHLPLFPRIHETKACISKILKDEKLLSQDPNMESTLVDDSKKLCFVRVTLNAYKEGVIEEGAVVCAPHLADIKLWTSGSGNKVELQVPQSSIASYFIQQPSGRWEFHIPEDPAAMESNRWPIGFVTTGFTRGSKKPSAGALCEAVLLARLRTEQWNSVPLKNRRKEIYVLVRNLKSTAYRLALANIVLEQKEDLDHM